MRTPTPRLRLGDAASLPEARESTAPPPSQSDEALEQANGALIALIQQDPDRGAAALFREFSGVVNQLVLHIAGGEADHDDIVQTTFCTLIETIHQVRELKKLEAWVRAVAVNAALQELRRRRFRRVFFSRLPEQSSTRSLVQDVEARDLLRRARRLLDLMPTRERVVFVLHHVEAQSLATIAETCRYSVATAKRRLARANRRFQQLIEADPELGQLGNRRRTKPPKSK